MATPFYYTIHIVQPYIAKHLKPVMLLICIGKGKLRNAQS